MQSAQKNLCTRLSGVNAAFYLFLSGVSLVMVLKTTHRHFSYTLDDPYIHLALAERLRHGLYGLNLGEPSSPSSSLLWPFLLVPFSGTALMSWAPLLLNVICGLLTSILLGRFVQRHFCVGWRALLLSMMLIPALNLVGLTFIGMEHSLEVLLCVAGALGIVGLLGERSAPMWTIVAVALLPSVRYEGCLILIAMAIALWGTKAKQKAIALVVAGVMPLLVFGLYLRHSRLPFFPLSVLTKSEAQLGNQTSVLQRFAHQMLSIIHVTLWDPERAPQFLLTIILACYLWKWRRKTTQAIILAGCTFVSAIQVMVGPIGWSFRYEIYCIAFTMIIVLWTDGQERSTQALRLTQESNTRSAIPGALLISIGALSMFYAQPMLMIPYAAAGIAGQQAQMGRFASQFYKGPVAVNDLGWVAFSRTPNQYVLDLAALGSYEVFKTPKIQRTPAWLDHITLEHKVGLVMIYPDWFMGTPSAWRPIAKMCFDSKSQNVGTIERTVIFYATTLADQTAIVTELRRFRSTLPATTILQIYPADTSQSCNLSKEDFQPIRPLQASEQKKVMNQN